MSSFSSLSSMIRYLGKINLISFSQNITRNERDMLKTTCCNRPNFFRSYCEYRSLVERPKKPLSSFFKYLQSVEDDLKIEFPDIKRKDLVKVAGERWNNIDPQEKAIYISEYKSSKRDYNLKMREYFERVEDDSGFLKWKMELDRQYQHSDSESDIKRAARDLSYLEKYHQVYDESRADYEEKKKEFSQLKKARKRAGAPTRPVSAYTIFIKDYYKNLINPGPLSVTSKAAALEWKSMDKARKMEYENRFQESLLIFQEQFTVWAERMVEEGRAEELGIEEIYPHEQ